MAMSRRRSVRGLFLSWIVYWILIAGIKLGPAAAAILRATRGPDDNTNSVGFNFGNWVFSLTVTEHNRMTWSGSAHLAEIGLWIGGVPLLLWIMWLTARPAERTARGHARQAV